MSFAMGQRHLFHTVGVKPHISHVFLNFIKNRRRLCPALGDYRDPYIFGLKLRASLVTSPLCGYCPGGLAPHFPPRQLWRARPHLLVLQLSLRQRTPSLTSFQALLRYGSTRKEPSVAILVGCRCRSVSPISSRKRKPSNKTP